MLIYQRVIPFLLISPNIQHPHPAAPPIRPMSCVILYDSTMVSNGGVECERGKGPFWSFLPWEMGFSQPELNQKNCGVILGRSGFPLVIIVHIKPNDTHNPLSHEIVGSMMLYVITATPKQDRKVFPGRYRCTMMYFIFPYISRFPTVQSFSYVSICIHGVAIRTPHLYPGPCGTSRLTWWLNLHLRFDVDIISSTFFVWVVSWPSNPKKGI